MESRSPPPTAAEVNPRFTLELEFVLALSNPAYLHWLSYTCPHLFNPPTSDGLLPDTGADGDTEDNSDCAKFTRYLAYLYAYWRRPAYSQFLTHPTATLWILGLLQKEQFRKDIVNPQLIERLHKELHELQSQAPRDGVTAEIAATDGA